MHDLSLEEKIETFMAGCDEWVRNRMKEILEQGDLISEADLIAIEGLIEENICRLLEQGVDNHGETFLPELLSDLHHLYFELELKKHGIKNEDDIHHYKENGMLGLSVVKGQIKPDNALLIMKINQAHMAKKKGRENEACDDCICGRNQGS
ncbi:MAG: hypothetical protein NTZ51_07445 [Proteobacteria bacterium]|nr:hypothetical protein [Pseudomonadota bacterium]